MGCLLVFWSQAGPVVDLGNLDVEGDVKRPMVQIIESDQKQRELLKIETSRSLKDLEALVLPRNHKLTRTWLKERVGTQ